VAGTIIDIKALNVTLQQTITPMFWGVVLTAVAVPIAAAVGGAVAGKILPKKER
jgi:hypothetical protein